MFINMLIIGGWITMIGIFGIGFYVRDLLEERKRKEENPWQI